MQKLFEITWLSNDATYPITEYQTGATKMEARGKIVQREVKTGVKKFLEVKEVKEVA